MSVTFQIEALATGRVFFECYEKGAFGPFDSVEDAQVAVGQHAASCEECDLYRPLITPLLDVDSSVNMSNTNAVMLMGILGLEVDEELCGKVEADTLLASALIALADERDTSSVADVVEKESGGPTVVHCGLPEDYVNMRLRALADMATEAKRLGRIIIWS